jgi:hypothetical protein
MKLSDIIKSDISRIIENRANDFSRHDLQNYVEMAEKLENQHAELIRFSVKMLNDCSCNNHFNLCVHVRCPLNFTNRDCNIRNFLLLIEKLTGKTWRALEKEQKE